MSDKPDWADEESKLITAGFRFRSHRDDLYDDLCSVVATALRKAKADGMREAGREYDLMDAIERESTSTLFNMIADKIEKGEA